MAKNGTTISINLDLILSNMKSELQAATKDLEKFGKNPSTEQLNKQFKALETRIEAIQTATKQPLGANEMQKLSKQVDLLDTDFKEVVNSYKNIKKTTDSEKLTFLDSNSLNMLNKAQEAIEEYKNATKEASETQEQLNKKKQELLSIDKKLKDNQDSQSKAKTSQDNLKLKQPKLLAKIKAEGSKLEQMDGRTKEGKAQQAALQVLEEQYKQNKQSIADYNTEIQQLQSTESSLRQTQATLTSEVNELNAEFQENSGTTQRVESAYRRLYSIASLTEDGVEDINNEFSKNDANKLLSQLKNLEKQGLDKVDKAVDENVSSLRTFSNEQKNLKHSVQESNSSLQQQDRAMENVSSLQSRIAQYIGMEGIINALSRSLRNAFEAVKELDAAMTEMAVVTDKDIGDYWKELPDYTARANALGLTIKDVYEADTLYYQQGLKTNEVVAISAETMKMAKIAGLDTAEATDRMTAALRGFNMELNETSAQKIADVYSELAAITASDVDEISTAMTKTASIASSAGMEFETTAAFLSQIIETTRESAETAGTAMKTVIARFQELKKSPDEIGEIDGEIVDANAIETALRSVGVALRDSSGQFRDLDDVFLELSSKWQSLDMNTQRYIATIAAGSRQQSRFIAMMQDYARTQELVTAANNSAGASAQQYEKTIESLETKLNKLKNAWNTFTMGLLNNELVKVFIGILTGILNAANALFGALDNIPLLGVAARVGVLIGGLVLLDKIITRFFVSLKNGNGILASGIGALRGYSLAQDGTKIASAKSTKQKAKENAMIAANVALMDESTKETYECLVAQFLQEEQYKDNAEAMALETMAESGVITMQQGENVSLWSLIKTKSKSIASTVAQTFADWAGVPAKEASTVATGEQTKATWLQVIANWALQHSMWFLLIVIVAVVAVIIILVVAIIAIVKSLNKEEKALDSAKEAQERATEAAEAAKESYEELSGALEDLSTKYDALEDLTKGTEDWNKAVLEINSSVMDLIQKYPELAGLVENEGGVLRLDVESSEVQDVLNSAYERTITTANLRSQANMRVNDAQTDVDRKNLKKDVSFVYGHTYTATGQGAQQMPLGLNNEQIDKYAKAVASGDATDKDSEAYEKMRNELGLTAEELKTLERCVADDSEALRQYGADLIAREQQEMAAYDAMAASVVGLTDTLGKSQERINQMYNLADGEVYKEAYDEKIAQMEGKNLIDGTSDGAQDSLEDASGLSSKQVTEAFAAAGYANATFDQDSGEVTYRDKDGKKQTEELTGDELRDILATYYATDVVTQRAENIDAYMEGMVANLRTPDNSEAVTAFEKALENAEGDELTSADLTALSELSDQDIRDAFNGLSEDLRNIYGSAEELVDRVNEAEKLAAATLNNANEELSELGIKGIQKNNSGQYEDTGAFANLSAGAKRGMADKLTEVSNKAGGKEAAQDVADFYAKALAGFDQEAQESIAQRINMTDWSSVEELTSLQYDLQYTYGVSAEKAAELTEGIGKANYAVSKFSLAVDEFGKMYQAQQQLTETTEKLTRLQWEYDQALKSGGSSLAAIRKEMLQSYEEQSALHLTRFAEAQSNINKIYAQGVGAEGIKTYGLDLSTITSLNDNGTVSYDAAEVTKLLNSGDLKKEQWESWLSSLQEQKEVLTESEEGVRETIEAIQELEETLKDSYDELREQAVEAYSEKLQEQIDLQQESLDATKEASDRIINKLQEQINAQRQKEENQKTEQEIADKQAQLSYLAMDTSGGDLLAQKDLEKQIVEDQQSYEDTLIDQSIQSLQDANEQAAEQRERQIAIQQAQLDAYLESSAFQYEVDHLMNEMLSADNAANSTLGDLLISSNTRGLSPNDVADWTDDFNTQAEQAKAYMAEAQDRADALTAAESTLSIITTSLGVSGESGVSVPTAISNVETAVKDKIAELSGVVLTDEKLRVLLANGTLVEGGKTFSINEKGNLTVTDEYGNTKMDTIATELKSLDALKVLAEAQGYKYDKNKGWIQDTDKQNAAIAKSYETTKGKLEGAGFSSKWIDAKIKDTGSSDTTTAQNAKTALYNAEALANKEDITEISKLRAQFSNGGLSIKDKAAYYSENIEKIAKGEAATYTEYLQTEKANKLKNLVAVSNGKTTTKEQYEKDLKAYTSLGGSKTDFEKAWSVATYGKKFIGAPLSKAVDGDGLDEGESVFNFDDLADDENDEGAIQIDGKSYHLTASGADSINTRGIKTSQVWYEQIAGTDKARLYVTNGSGTSYLIKHEYDSGDLLKKYGLTQYETGGLADFTGPAWLDGTKSRPEYILNADQTKRFFSLIDVLEGFDKNTNDTKKSGDSYFDININVDKLESDYDVEQVADKIRRMIYEDAAYRNVNAINKIR